MDVLREAALESPDAQAIDDGEGSWTFAELDAAAGRMARRLAPLGAGAGATVALLAEPGPLAVQAVFAASRLGATLAPLNLGLRGPELEAALEALGPDLILSTRAAGAELDLDPSWLTELDDLPMPPPGADTTTENEGEPAEEPEPFAILWTSGTSGTPRGVPLSAKAFRLVGSASSPLLDSGPGARWYASLSLGHVGGLALVLRAVQHGATLVTRGSFDAEELAGLVTAGAVTHASLVPTMLEHLLRAMEGRPAPSTLRCLLVGGAHASPPLVERALALGYPLAHTYGMTETTSQVATAPSELVRAKPGTVGLPLDGVEVRISPEDEILVRGPTVASAYVGDSAPLLDADGWYATGDLGRLDTDGHLWVSGRIAARIISGGVNVDPLEVEEALRRLPDVADAAVVGLDDPEWGERVAALVVPEAAVRPVAAELIDRLEERLSSAKIPRVIRVVEALPRSPSGKVDLGAVRDLLA